MTRPAWFERCDRTRILIHGPDRAKFLHNLTTNEVKRLAPGEGREAFVTSPQGKTLGWIQYQILRESILVRLDAPCRDACLAHLSKYGVFDDVQLEEIGDRTFEIVVAGPGVELEPAFGSVGLPEKPQSVVDLGDGLLAIRDDPTGSGGLTFVGPGEARTRLAPILGDPMTPEAFEASRIEAGTPVFGADIGPNHLPQEVGRDGLAINFVKGCYLGQETVARLDALGHVNKLLVALEGDPDAEVPPAGSKLERAGVEVGILSSSARSRGRAVGLGYVKVPMISPGDRIDAVWETGRAVVRVTTPPVR
ncbi:MAG: glycine cleavage T C-terminal barrel domain-containing protein [Isosphaeraceae bacterium]|nr:glycine cleavage T C-terminal barrel domain-containing protein [Isosphaeraceae bacterium]